MLHFAPLGGCLEHNFELIELAAEQAAEGGAALLLTPELALSGYDFVPTIGTSWIATDIPAWRERFAELARRHAIAILATMPERDEHSGLLHNAAALFDSAGNLRAKHRKIAVIPGGCEAWSRAGDSLTVADLHDHRMAIIICADACLSELAGRLAAQDPDLIVSSAAWSPGIHEPAGEWEELSVRLSTPVLVCNRSGRDGWSFEGAASTLVIDGRRVESWTEAGPTLILVRDVLGARPNWDPRPLDASRAADPDTVCDKR